MFDDKYVEAVRKRIPMELEFSSIYLGENFFARWVISPCPSFLDGYDTAFGIYPAREDGQEGEAIFCGTEFECYEMFVELFPDTPVLRSADYCYIY